MKSGLLSIAVSLCLSVAAQAATVYVDADAGGGIDDGTSWADAFTNLQDALTSATGADEIWVAEGTYYPGTLPAHHFTLLAGYGVYGGFNGTESNLVDRMLRTYETILSGDLDRDSLVTTTNSDHVVNIDSADAADGGRLDGFTITQGYGDYGGGVRVNNAGDVTIANCTITSNSAANGTHGAAFCNYTASLTGTRLENCLIYNNFGGVGAVCNYGDMLTVVNCTFYNNDAETHGFSWYVSSGMATVYNCIIWDDDDADAGGEGGGINERYADSVHVSYSLVNGGWRGNLGGTAVLDQEPRFMDAANGVFYPWDSCPSINAGINSNAPTVDIAGIARPQSSTHDAGAYEWIVWPDSEGPDPVGSMFTVGETNWVSLDWMNPTNTDFIGVVILRKVDSAPSGAPTDGVTYTTNDTIGGDDVIYVGFGIDSYFGRSGGWVDWDVIEDENYFYSVFAYDEVPNYSPVVNTNQHAFDTEVPQPVSNLIALAVARNVTLDWQNAYDPDFSGVMIVRQSNTPPSVVPLRLTTYTQGEMLDGVEVVYSGPGYDVTTNALSGWLDPGGSPGIDYYYQVFSFDEIPNYSVGTNVFGAKPVASELEGIVHVKWDAATTNNDGTTWDTAYTNLQYAMGNSPTGTTFWIAKGTYSPGPLVSDYLAPKKWIKMYGGFEGWETRMDDRNWVSNATAISGDLNTNGVADSADNRCLIYNISDTRMVLDGITFEYTSGLGGNPRNCSGAIFNRYACMTIANCTFRNLIGVYGGAIYNRQGGVYKSTFITNSLFYGNYATSGPGAIGHYYRGTLEVVNCTFADNQGGGGYGDVHHAWSGEYPSEGTIYKNCILWDSSPNPSFSGEVASPWGITVIYSDVVDGWTGTGNIQTNPLFRASVSNNYNLVEGSSCIDAGTDTATFLDWLDLNHQSRVYHEDEDNPDGIIDMGCFEWPESRIPFIPGGSIIMLYGNDDGFLL